MGGRRWILLRMATIMSLAVFATSPFASRRSGSPAPTAAASLRVDVSGCAAVLADGTCEREAGGEIRVWGDAPGPVDVRVDGESIEVAEVPAANGTCITLRRAPVGRLEIEAGGKVAWLRVAEPTTWGWAEEASRARSRGDADTVARLVEPHLTDGDLASRSRAEGLLARIMLTRGDTAGALRWLRAASIDAAAVGRTSDAVDDGLALSFALSQRAGRHDEARTELARIEPLLGAYPDGRARQPYYRALVSAALGDLRGSLRDLRASRAEAERLGLGRLVWNVRNEWALTLERMGRHDEALVELESLANAGPVASSSGVAATANAPSSSSSSAPAAKLANVDSGPSACERANVLHNLGFGLVERGRARRSPCSAPLSVALGARGDASRWLRASLELSEKSCPDRYRIAMSHVLLGELALQHGDLGGAERELANGESHAAGAGQGSELRRRRLDLEGKIALARHDGHAALSSYERLVAAARASGRIDDERRALEGRAEALEVLGRRRAAQDAFAEADELLSRASVLVPIGEATSYEAGRDDASRARIELVLAGASPNDTRAANEALELTRRARVRVLSTLTSLDAVAELDPAARARWDDAIVRYRAERKALDAEAERDWELATSELERVTRQRADKLAHMRGALDDAMGSLRRDEPRIPPLDASVDTWLVVTTLRRGAVVVVRSADVVKATKIDLFDDMTPDVAARRIMEAAANELRTAHRVKVLTSADLACLDLHAQRLFADSEPLGLTIPVTYAVDLATPPRASARPERAVVVSDTHDDLPLARDEAALALQKLTRTGDVVHLGGRRALRGTVVDELARATVLHYAGHAEDQAGEIALPLAMGGRLTVGDVLALPASPDRVVLSACAAGRVSSNGMALGMGLVQAFFEKGASDVLAPSRPVRDEVARELAASLETWSRDGFDRALRRLAVTRVDADWAAYRVWGR